METLYFRVKEGTHAIELFNKTTECAGMFDKHIPEIEEKLGCKASKNLSLCTDNLMLSNPPAHLKDQFSKRKYAGDYRALKNSPINTWWVEFCKENNLEFYGWEDLGCELGFIRYKRVTRTSKLTTHLLKVNVDEESDINYWKGRDYLEPLTESEYLRTLAQWAEEREKEAVNQ